MGPLSDAELAYTAGLFDGEGCVRIQRFQRSSGKAGKRCEVYVLMVQITNVDPRAVFPVREMFGGSVHVTKHKSPAQRDTYVWITTSQCALRFLKAIQPWLKAKADQADVAIQFQEAKRHHGGKAKPTEDMARERRQYAEISELKYRTFTSTDYGMVANSGNGQNGRPRAKQSGEQVTFSMGVCNEQVPPATAKMCSELHGNMQSAAETTALGS